ELLRVSRRKLSGMRLTRTLSDSCLFRRMRLPKSRWRTMLRWKKSGIYWALTITTKSIGSRHSTMPSCISRPRKPIKVRLLMPIRRQLTNIINSQTDLPPGQKMKLAELKALVDDDNSIKNLSREQEEELINKLLEHRDIKKNGLRANNAA